MSGNDSPSDADPGNRPINREAETWTEGPTALLVGFVRLFFPLVFSGALKRSSDVDDMVVESC